MSVQGDKLQKPVLKIDLPEWVAGAEAKNIMTLIGGGQEAPQSLFVGGCVRNAVLATEATDIDIATQFSPQEVTEKLEAAGIKVVPTGIEYGTVTAVINGKSFEITTLRRDAKTDGRRAEVSFTDDWVEDARRRDFTMNTLLADLAGNIYDPTGQGLAHLRAGKVVFVGDAATRITEDYLRILRFFRFYAVYGKGEADAAALSACAQAAEKIFGLSKERITQEFLKILAAEKAVDILSLMFNHGVMKDFPHKNYQPEVLGKLVAYQQKYAAQDILPRLFVLAGFKTSFFENYLRLSHAQKKFLIKLEMATQSVFYRDEKSLKKAIFYHGNKLLLQGYLLMMSNGEALEDAVMIEAVMNWQAPACSVTGETLIAEGYKTGPELGQELIRRQEEWLEELLEE